MNNVSYLYLAMLLPGFVVMTACNNPEPQIKAAGLSAQTAGEAQEINVDQRIEDWPKASKNAAKMMVEKYGQPSDMTSDMLIWKNNGPWKRTVLYREEVQHNFPVKHTDVLEQFIDYKVPITKFNDLAAYDGSVIAERTKGEISARCDNEHMNFLAVNLANDVALGKKTVQNAREFYAKTAMEFQLGTTSPYTEKLMFEASKGNTADPDETMILKGAKEAIEDVVN